FSSLCPLCLCGSNLFANPPVAQYIFPPGGQRGKTVEFRVGGLFLHRKCGFEMLGPGVAAGQHLEQTKTVWFEGPLLPLPASQQAEDYPRDMAGRVAIAADAPLGVRYWRTWTSQGATPALPFVIGDLPEIVEQEIDGDPVPVDVTLPVTVNGRIFPREDVDVWQFPARKGQSITCEVAAARIGSPLDSRIEVLDPQGRPVAENDDHFGADSFVRFTAPADGKYRVRIHDVSFRGGQAFVYRLTLTAGPHVERVYPLGGRRGGKVKLELTGQGLPAGPAEVDLPADGPREHSHRLRVGDQFTNPFALDLDDLAEHLETEPNDRPEQVKPLSVPAVCNGRIGNPGDMDCWAFACPKGEALDIELRAARLGSPLLGVLTVLDAAGKELARAESPAPGADPQLRFTAPAEGTYFVRVADRFRSRGGPAFAYRLRIDRPTAPDFHLRLAADALTLTRGTPAKVRIMAERVGGFKEPIALAVDGLPPGVSVTGTTLAANQIAVDLTFKAEPTAAIRAARLTVRGTAKVGGRTVTRTASLPPVLGRPTLDSLLLAVALPTPFKVVGEYEMGWVHRGTIHKRRYKLIRNGFDGPVEVRLADRQARHLQGVTGPTITVPAGATEFEYPVYLPPWMETGRTSRTCVMAVGVVKDHDGSEHVVSFSSVQQNEQIVAVVEPGRLDVSAERASVAVTPGGSLTLPVRVARGKGLRGEAKVELVLAPHIRGVSAEPVVIPADRTDGVLTLRFAKELRGPFNMPAVIRATITDRSGPVVAEVKLELQR
ncbi:MAG TPA: PPC domain-containing protein, partial [Gemmataceae bacterium]|nr:PPC domain-containing protein [Gemmataceae bacterium]